MKVHLPLGRRTFSRWCGWIAAALALSPLEATAQPVRVEYDVVFRVQVSPLDVNCAWSGTDVLTGTLTGYEPVPRGATRFYVGTLVRTTRISHCGSRTNATTGTDVVCSMSISGDGLPEVMFSIEDGQNEGYLQHISNRAQFAALLATVRRPVAQIGSSVNGTCEPAEMAQMQTEYDLGQTGGSPSGQPIEFSRFPPAAYPSTFPANPPRTTWSLTVTARRP